MLFHSIQGGGYVAPKFVTNFTFIASTGTTGTTTATVPSSSQVGDLCVIVAVGVVPSPAPPSGWTQVSITNGSLFCHRIVYKILTSGDIGTSVVLNGSGNVGSYGATCSLVFRGNIPISAVHISSLNTQGETNTTVSSVKDTSLYPPSNIIIATKSDYNIYYSTYSTAISGSFWNGGISKTVSLQGLAISYEIQNSSNTNRTVSPANASSSNYQHMHSFVLNAAG